MLCVVALPSRLPAPSRTRPANRHHHHLDDHTELLPQFLSDAERLQLVKISSAQQCSCYIYDHAYAKANSLEDKRTFDKFFQDLKHNVFLKHPGEDVFKGGWPDQYARKLYYVDKKRGSEHYDRVTFNAPQATESRSHMTEQLRQGMLMSFGFGRIPNPFPKLPDDGEEAQFRLLHVEESGDAHRWEDAPQGPTDVSALAIVTWEVRGGKIPLELTTVLTNPRNKQFKVKPGQQAFYIEAEANDMAASLRAPYRSGPQDKEAWTTGDPVPFPDWAHPDTKIVHGAGSALLCYAVWLYGSIGGKAAASAKGFYRGNANGFAFTPKLRARLEEHCGRYLRGCKHRVLERTSTRMSYQWRSVLPPSLQASQDQLDAAWSIMPAVPGAAHEGDAAALCSIEVDECEKVQLAAGQRCAQYHVLTPVHKVKVLCWENLGSLEGACQIYRSRMVYPARTSAFRKLFLDKVPVYDERTVDCPAQ